MSAPTAFRRTASPAARRTVPAGTPPDVSFVYVTFGTEPTMIDASIDRLLASCDADGIHPEILVVDNEHPVRGHATGHHLAVTSAGIRLALPNANLGFGGGNDLGAAAARSTTLCLINADLMVDPGWLPPLLALLEQHPGDVVAPRLLDADGALDEAGQLVGPDAHTRPAPSTADRIDYASAACWLMATATHEAVGGFDPRFHPAYYEDVDFAFRLRRLGRRIRVHPEVSVTHLRGGSVSLADAPIDISEQMTTMRRLWSSDLWRQAPLDTR